MDIYRKLEELNLKLPKLPPRGGIYKPVKKVGNLLYISGQGATVEGVPAVTGKLGINCTMEEGQRAAKICTMNALSVLEDYLGDLNRIQSVVKVLAFVSSGPDFHMQPKVIDSASKLLADIWGDDGIGVRSAIGVADLPGDIAVEIEFIFEMKE